MRIQSLPQKKKILCLAAGMLAGLCLFALRTPVYATEPDYSVQITPEMDANGISPDPRADVQEETSSRVMVSGGITYDQVMERYCYGAGTGDVYSNVLDGMVVQGTVVISGDDGISYTVCLDSEPLEVQQEYELSTPGSYAVMTGSENSQQKLFSFQIIGTATNQLMSYALPTGCMASSMQLDGEDVLIDNRMLDFATEGHYAITYQCVRSNVTYSLDFTVDRTPPTLTVEGLKGNKARGPVTITDLEEGVTLLMTKDGDEIKAKKNISQPGEYHVQVTDAAGNTNEYTFFILFYLNAGGISFGSILLVCIIALGIYLYISRKRLRVR